LYVVDWIYLAQVGVQLLDLVNTAMKFRVEWRAWEDPGYFSDIALGYCLDGRGFDFRQGLGIFLFTTSCRLVWGPTHPPIQWIPGALSTGVKRPRREDDHSTPSSAVVKNAWNCTSTSPIRLHSMVLS
jgi:hypothetical protein